MTLTDSNLSPPQVPALEMKFWDANFRFSSFLPGFLQIISQQGQDSAAYRLERQQKNLTGKDLVYGSKARQFVRQYRSPEATERAVAFVHGGYWRAMSVDDHDFVGPLFGSAVDFYNVEYRLQPAIGFSEQVADVHRALELVLEQCQALNIKQLDVYGHSAGAHLSFCALQQSRPDGFGNQRLQITLNCISGIYDLQPVSRSFLAGEVDFQEAELQRFSPLRQTKPFTRIPYVISVGGNETPEYLRQAFLLTDKLVKNGCDASFKMLEGANHFQTIQANLAAR